MDPKNQSQTILAVAKQEGSLSTEEITNLFTTNNDLEAIKDAVKRAKDRVYLSWASVDGRDKDGERIPIDELIANQDILLERDGPITDQHTNAVIGKTLAYKVLEHPKSKSLGVLHLNKIHNHARTDDTVWKEIVEGKRTGSSVAGDVDPEKISYEMDKESGMPTRILGGFVPYETASVVSPANPLALNEAYSLVAKSHKTVQKGREALFQELHEKTGLDRETFDAAYLNAYSEGRPAEAENTEKNNIGESMDAKKQENQNNAHPLDSVFKKVKAEEELSEEERRMLLEAVDMEESKEEESEDDEEQSEKGEDASADVEGVRGSDNPEVDEQRENSNEDPVAKDEEDVAKDEKIAKMEKELETLKKGFKNVEAVAKSRVQRPEATEKVERVKKANEELNDYAVKIAKGEVKDSWNAVHHKMREFKHKVAKERAAGF